MPSMPLSLLHSRRSCMQSNMLAPALTKILDTHRSQARHSKASMITHLQVSLTNSSTALYGCVNVTATGSSAGGCNTTNVTSASFTFQAGERVTSMTLWPGYNAQGVANQRAGAVNFKTSLVSLPLQHLLLELIARARNIEKL